MPCRPKSGAMDLPLDPSRYLVFLGLLAVLCATPGPANLFAIATGVQRGHRAVFAGVAGMNTATLVWFGASALGLSAVIVAFPQWFRFIALAGAAYLAWLAAKALWTAARPGAVPGKPMPQARPGKSAFFDGFAVQIANPKAVLFFSAVLPPFLAPDRPLAPQLAGFAVVGIAIDAAFMSAYGLGGAALSARMAQPAFRRAFSAGSGALLLLAALLVVLH
jgi:threonine/homoserine/homoserine lactone efflux protein